MATTDETVVGREDELAALADFLDGPPPPRILLLEGDAGIGKTTLWRRGVELGEARGIRALTWSGNTVPLFGQGRDPAGP